MRNIIKQIMKYVNYDRYLVMVLKDRIREVDKKGIVTVYNRPIGQRELNKTLA